MSENRKPYACPVTKAAWYRAGGLKNPRCWRRMNKRGVWEYFINYNQPA